jgi:hypothetical protein
MFPEVPWGGKVPEQRDPPKWGSVVPFRPRGGSEQWVTKEQLARHMQVSTRTVERWVAEGMPCLRHRRTMRFQLAVCEHWLGART